MRKKQEVVIVGGGPVGSWTGAEIARRNPQAGITRYERHAEYARKHVLKLEHASLLLYSKSGADERRQQLLEEITGHNLLGVFGRVAGSVFIPTSALESALTGYAGAMGINMVQQKIENPFELMERHPDCRHFIAADGAHSLMREMLLGPEETALKTRPLQYVVEVKYRANGRAGHLDFLGEQYKTQKILDHLAFEYVGKEREGITPVTLRFFVTPETYKAMPEASFKTPLQLHDPALPAALGRDISTYMNARAAMAGEKYQEGSAVLSKLTLNMYHATDYAIDVNGRNWHFVGDAAIGVPYFRALNAGIIGGSAVAAILAGRLSQENQRRAHNTYGPLSVAWEFSAARGKNFGLKAYDLWRGASAVSPLEIHRFSEAQKLDLRSNYHKAFTPRDQPQL